MSDIPRIVASSDFNEIHIQIYSQSLNIMELFELIDWKPSKAIKLTIEFINVDLPTNINIYEYISNVDKMVRRNNGDIPLASLSLIFNPKFYEFGSIDRYITDPRIFPIINNFPTQELSIDGLKNTNFLRNYAFDPIDTKGKVQKFLDTSTIPTIDIVDIGNRKDGKSTVY